MPTGTSRPSKAQISTFRTDANFDGKQYFLVKHNGDNDLDLCGAGELATGALGQDVGVDATGEKFVAVQIGGQVVVKAGGTCTAGTLLMSDGAGEAIAATDGNFAIGTCLVGGADGADIVVNWSPSYYETT